MITAPSSLSLSLRKKLFVVIGGILIVSVCIFLRLLDLQVRLGNDFTLKSKKNFLRHEPTASLRGNIIDCNGKLLATNRPVIDIYWKGTGNRTLSLKQEETITHLQNLLEKDFTEQAPEILGAERKAAKFLLAKDVSFDELSKISEFFSWETNILIETNFARFYPYQNLASHALGYLGNDLIPAGKMGLEKYYETVLKGKNGITQRVLNSFGKNLSEKQLENALAGQNINLTLDLGLQQLAETIFPADRKGAFILMDSRDGGIIVALSRPNFDPNLFMQKMNEETWQKVQEDRPFLNRIFAATYPPGSIFKLVTLSAALETNLITRDTEWFCSGSMTLGNRESRCHKQEGHGKLTTVQIISKSCNVPFYKIAKTLDIDTIARYANLFGLGRNITSIFNNMSGFVPTRKWKREKKKERWWLGETLSTAIGQSYLLVTPIQVARLIASIETGYLISPRILKDSALSYEPLPIKTETRKFLQDTMRAVIQEGTAQRLNRMRDFYIYGKTSTAQTSALELRDQGGKYLEHKWLVANVRYKNNPPMTFVVIVENAGSEQLALDFAKSFLKAYRDLMELRDLQTKKHPLL